MAFQSSLPPSGSGPLLCERKEVALRHSSQSFTARLSPEAPQPAVSGAVFNQSTHV